MKKAAPAEETRDFSVVLGGPLFQLLRRTHLSGDALELLRRRIIILPLFAWLPLLVLSVMGGHAWGDSVALPFLDDIEVHIRFLLAVPLLIFAEVGVHKRFLPVPALFLERGLIPPASRARFEAALASAARLRNSMLAEMLLIAVVYLVGALYLWPNVALHVPTWYGTPQGDEVELSAAGWWLVYASLPLFQFLLLRWYFRLFVWVRFLWQITRGELSLIPTHPDRAGGLAFLSEAVLAWTPLLLAHGTLLSGAIATRIMSEGSRLTDFTAPLVVLPCFLLVISLGPLFLFAPHLAAARRRGLLEYGTLADGCVREFDAKWLRGGAPAGETLIGSGDSSSLADFGASFGVIEQMRLVPFTKGTALTLILTTLLPVSPLLLTMFSLEEIVKTLLSIIV